MILLAFFKRMTKKKFSKFTESTMYSSKGCVQLCIVHLQQRMLSIPTESVHCEHCDTLAMSSGSADG